MSNEKNKTSVRIIIYKVRMLNRKKKNLHFIVLLLYRHKIGQKLIVRIEMNDSVVINVKVLLMWIMNSHLFIFRKEEEKTIAPPPSLDGLIIIWFSHDNNLSYTNIDWFIKWKKYTCGMKQTLLHNIVVK